MFVVVEHTIADPVGFANAVEQAMPNVPTNVKLHQVLPNADGTAAVCLWECDSLEKVRQLVDATTGAFSSNKYFEVAPDSAVGLPRG
jgi:hypothetical protein